MTKHYFNPLTSFEFCVFLLGLTPCKVDTHYEAWGSKKKKYKKIKAYRKSFEKEPTDISGLLISDIKPFEL